MQAIDGASISRAFQRNPHARKAEEQRENRVSTGQLVAMFGRDNEEVVELLGPDGPIAASLPGYRPRSEQQTLARMVERSLATRTAGTYEAGTGTGKSIGYLVPAILHAMEKKVKVVVSTGTLALQGQLAGTDLPFLQRTLGEYLTQRHGRNFTWAMLKGKPNYVCLAKPAAEVPWDLEDAHQQLIDWMDETETGDIGELAFDMRQPEYWPLQQAYLAVDEDDCPGRNKCQHGRDGECWYYRARDRANDADVLVVNHMLLALDAATGGLILPEFDAVVVDEAHQLEDYARKAFTKTLSPHRVRRLTKKAHKLGVNQDAVDELVALNEEFFCLADAHVKQLVQRPGEEVRLQFRNLGPELLTACDRLAGALCDVRERCEALASDLADTPGGAKAESLARSLERVSADFLALNDPGLGAARSPSVISAKVKDAAHHATITIVPLEVGGLLKSTMWDGKVPVLTSATLAAGTGEKAFEYVKSSLGLDGALTLQVGSPFNYLTQCLYYLPVIPKEAVEKLDLEPSHVAASRWSAAIAPEICRVLEATCGRAFVLFTSHAALQATWERCKHLCALFPMARQGDFSKAETGRRFKRGLISVLFATGSYWEGIDVPGDRLSCVIIDRIPFPTPSDPVESARKERHGRSAFRMFSLPTAIMKMKQGVGRLLRTETDRGLLVLLDPKLRENYGAEILRALPGDPSLYNRRLSEASLPMLGKFLAPVRPPEADDSSNTSSPPPSTAIPSPKPKDPDLKPETNKSPFESSIYTSNNEGGGHQRPPKCPPLTIEVDS